jgi:hypothetical protein
MNLIVFCECGVRTSRSVIAYDNGYYDVLYKYNQGVFGVCKCGKNLSPRKIWAKRKRQVPASVYLGSNIKVNENNGCWEWEGTVNQFGYGIAIHNRKRYVAHRFSWEILKGEIPDNLFVCHKCDNRKCVNTDHLFLGTQKDNLDDMVQKGRMRKFTLFTDEKMLEIKKSYEEQVPKNISEIARIYGVSRTLVHRAIKMEAGV